MIKINIGLGAVYVCVDSNGKLEEYDVRGSQDTAKQECYIASEADQPFSVRVVSSGESLFDQRVDVHLDGVWVRGVILRAGTPTTVNLDAAIHTTNLQSVERSFVFGKMKLKEDDSSTEVANAGISADLGTIRVELQAITIGEPRPFTNVATSLPGDEAISEKAKKAGAHTARFGEARSIPYQSYTSTIRMDAFPKHQVIFRYAPLDFLYAREVVRRPQYEAGPSRSTGTSDVKRKSADKSGAVKLEKVTTTTKTQGGGEIVDLSSDDDEDGDEEEESDTGLTEEEKAMLARLNAKKRANVRQGKQTQVKKAKLEHADNQATFTPGEVIVISDSDSD